jgi:hypothetical protein
MYQNSEQEDELGNISELLEGKVARENSMGNNTGMDQTRESGYTTEGGPVRQTEDLPSAGLKASGRGGDLTEDLPDMDSVAGLFSSPSEELDERPVERPEPERKPSGNKAQKMEGDFDAKELAAGIRTILSKD